MLGSRRFAISGGLGVLLLGAGCPDPSGDQATDGSESSGDDTGGSVPSSSDSSSGERSSVDPGDEAVDSGTGDTGAAGPVCGNGLVEAGESCDDEGESSLCDADCTAALCGDGRWNAQAGEECDVADLGAQTCEGLGFDVGVLACGDACRYDVSECYFLPDTPTLELSVSPVKRFDFAWEPGEHADHYRLEQSLAPGAPFELLGGGLAVTSISHEVPLHARWQASYRLWACNNGGCRVSAVVSVMDALTGAVGYIKAGSPDAEDRFGRSVVVSADGNTLAVGATREDSDATGVGGDGTNDSAPKAGAVYVYRRDGLGVWSQEAYIKASNTDEDDRFGSSVALSEDGSTLAVGAVWEDGAATGVGGDQADNSAINSGAVYVYRRDGMGAWSQEAYVKASYPDNYDWFGEELALSGDGSTLAVGATYEDSDATGVGGDDADDSMSFAGAVYVYGRDGMGAWSQEAYVKASNPDPEDYFGRSVALSADGSVLAVSAHFEDGGATGVNGDEADNSAAHSGAVYVFERDGMGAWSQKAYVKASSAGVWDLFGGSVALSGDGRTLAVGATGEDRDARGVGGLEAGIYAPDTGAVYVFGRDAMDAWSQAAYVKASNSEPEDHFGVRVSLSGDGGTLAVSSLSERSQAAGIDGDQDDNSSPYSGAVYLY